MTVGGGGRRWFGGGRAENQRAEAQAAKDAAAAAFYELDTAQRGLRISIETITAVDGSPDALRVIDQFAALGRRIDDVSHAYIEAVDSYDLDRVDLEGAVAVRARTDLNRARDELVRVKGELERFEQQLGPLLATAETQLARLAPAVERARAALLAASNALDDARAGGLRADDLAARLAALGPELTKLNQGAGQHGVQETLRRADRVLREAEAIRAEAERLPERAAETDRRLVSLRTRAQALAHRAASVDPVLSELRRRFSAACWQDLQPVPARARTTYGAPSRRWRRRPGRARSSAGRMRPRCCPPYGRCSTPRTRTCRPPVSGCGGWTRWRRIRSRRWSGRGSRSGTPSGSPWPGATRPTRSTRSRSTTRWRGWSGPSATWRAASGLLALPGGDRGGAGAAARVVEQIREERAG